VKIKISFSSKYNSI